MKIDQICLNGRSNPVGAALPYLSLSWKISEAASHTQRSTTVTFAEDPTFRNILFTHKGKLNCRGELLDFTPSPRTRYYIRVEVEGEHGEHGVSEDGAFFFETGKMQEDMEAKWIGIPSDEDIHPFLCRTITVKSQPIRARAYVCALGVYELYVGNEKVGDNLLAPFFGDYSSYLQRSTYELSLQTGENELRILLGKGWYMGRFGLEGRVNNFGDRMAAIAEIRITYADGTEEIIGTDEDWRYFASDIIASGIYDGEVIDRTAFRSRANPSRPVCTVHADGVLSLSHLTDRISQPLRVQEILLPTAVLYTPNGETVLDFGQNFAGFVAFDADLEEGRAVTLEYGEILQNGCFYRDNLRSAKAQFRYVSGGKAEEVRPHFTYFGFRYVRLTGFSAPQPEQFRGCVVHTDLRRTGELQTGNAQINRLFENVIWSMRSNFFDLPTDCPQRDERLAWTGDAQVFAPAASYLADTRAFYDRFCRELRIAQKQNDGGVPNYVPSFSFLSEICNVWGDVAVMLPDTLYRQYGDLTQLSAHYPMMRDWVDYLARCDHDNGNCGLITKGFQFGDWLALDGITAQSMRGGTDEYYIASMYYYASTSAVAAAAQTLGFSGDSAHYTSLAKRIRAAILQEFFSSSGRLTIDTQTGYLIALRFGVWVDREKLLAGLRERLRRDRYRVTCGFVGAPRLCVTLAEQGMLETAYDFLLQEDYPSWLYCVRLGATTIWERWNSVLPNGQINPVGMNSLNHYAYGAVVEFLFAYAAGIRPLAPGFSRARIEPVPDIRLGELHCRYESASGSYCVDWEIRSDGTMYVSVEIPFDCTAEVVLPGCDRSFCLLGHGKYDYVYRPEVDYRRPYRLDTPLDVLARDRRAMKILRELVPAFADMAEGNDAEKASVTLGQLPQMHYIPHEEAALDEAIEQICSLLYDQEALKNSEKGKQHEVSGNYF